MTSNINTSDLQCDTVDSSANRETLLQHLAAQLPRTKGQGPLVAKAASLPIEHVLLSLDSKQTNTRLFNNNSLLDMSQNANDNTLNRLPLTESGARDKMSLHSVQPPINEKFRVIISKNHNHILVSDELGQQTSSVTFEGDIIPVVNDNSPSSPEQSLSVQSIVANSTSAASDNATIAHINDAVNALSSMKAGAPGEILLEESTMKSFVKLMDSRSSEFDRKFLINYIISANNSNNSAKPLSSNSLLDSFVENKGVVVLRRWLEDSKDLQTLILTILKFIKLLPMNISRLQDSKIGKVIKSITKAQENEEICRLAYELVDNWKVIIAKAAEKEKEISTNSTSVKKAESSTDAQTKRSTVSSNNPQIQVSVKKKLSAPSKSVTPQASQAAASDFFKTIATATAPLPKIRKADSSKIINSENSANSSPKDQKPAKTSTSTNSATVPTSSFDITHAENLSHSKNDTDMQVDPSPSTPYPSYRRAQISTEQQDSDEISIEESNSRKRKRKTVSWAIDHELVKIRYIPANEDTDEQEGSRPKFAGDDEKDEMKRVRQFASEVSSKMVWNTPQKLALPKNVSELVQRRGAASSEKETQREREKGILSVSYFRDVDIPPSPAEPDNTAIVPNDLEINIIPIPADIIPAPSVAHMHLPFPSGAPGKIPLVPGAAGLNNVVNMTGIGINSGSAIGLNSEAGVAQPPAPTTPTNFSASDVASLMDQLNTIMKNPVTAPPVQHKPVGPQSVSSAPPSSALDILNNFASQPNVMALLNNTIKQNQGYNNTFYNQQPPIQQHFGSSQPSSKGNIMLPPRPTFSGEVPQQTFPNQYLNRPQQAGQFNVHQQQQNQFYPIQRAGMGPPNNFGGYQQRPEIINRPQQPQFGQEYRPAPAAQHQFDQQQFINNRPNFNINRGGIRGNINGVGFNNIQGAPQQRPPNYRQSECVHFQRKGYCWRGDDCNFAHTSH